MSTHVTTHRPVRDDVAPMDHQPRQVRRSPRSWAYAGVGAALSGIVGSGGAIAVDAVYDRSIGGDAPAVLAKLAGQTTQMLVFHVGVSLSAVLLAVFALGLHRRLRDTFARDSLVPALAAFGLLATAVVLVMGTALDTEFVFGVAEEGLLVPEAAVVYNHWIGTVPGCWMLAGFAGLALFAAARRGGVPRWLGLTGLVLGGFTLVIGVSPLQYMAGLTGLVWLLVTSLGLAFGDKAYRRS